MRKFFAVFHARNKEFVRDRGSLGWGLLFPFVMLIGFFFIFNRDQPPFTVAVTAPEPAWNGAFFEIGSIDFLEAVDRDEALAKVGRHQLDMALDPGPPGRYWINSSNANGALLETLLRATGGADWERGIIQGTEIRYVDWFLPGLLGMNVMFGSLIGVGFVLVRYRKAGILRRLKVTPLSAFEFLSAQVASRMLLMLFTTAIVYAGSIWVLGLRVVGSHLAVGVVFALGSFALISLGLIFASRTSSEELAGGLMNLATWPMMLLSGVFFPLESAPEWFRRTADFLPLTPLVRGARRIMTEGASLADVAPELGLMAGMSVVFLLVGSVLFRWE